jgi:putative heme-binding domain-containing protein
MYFRMAKFGRDRMPHLGSEWPDEAGLRLMEDWIGGMKSSVKVAAPPISDKLDEVFAQPRLALLAARRLGRGELQSADRERLLTAAAQLPPGAIRDLFDGYLPDEGRKLGSNPRPKSILSLAGDSSRGEKLFYSQALNCGNCHKIGTRGTALGPDLTSIGSQRSRADLLESILEPSRRIEPKFAAYVAHTADGRSFTGLVIKRDDKVVVLRDAQNQEMVLAAKNVEELRPSRTSLMPAGQLASLTAQEAADLLEFVASRK